MAFLFGVLIPYVALAVFFCGVVYRVVTWGRSPVPFRIPVTGGQQKSLPWIRHATLDNPSSGWGVIGRMALEVLFFRSLLRNTKMELREGPKLTYHWEKWLWLAGLTFHWSLAIVLLRHLRFFLQPVPGFVRWVTTLDGFFQIGLPVLYITDITFVLALSYLLWRRVAIPQVRYISLPTDYILPALILGVAFTGILMRYVVRVDVTSVKELILGWVTFHPTVPAGIGLIFYLHLASVNLLIAYLPFSKLTHMVGIFMTPTRNLPNDSRTQRHVNPWNPPVHVHTYEEYEDEFRDKMRQAGLPLEKES
ncbi:MAG TPA: sulfate reduction electron transfer complex DsrMKJOP subunit DsrM [Symbiobacteriaceae bacterium]|jgi:nitrate reductase gamma subunit